MRWRLYDELVPWYRLIDPVEEHAEEAACFAEAFERAASPRPRTLLELGAGAGHNAFHLKRRFACTLVDPSPPMQALSRELNPECEHAPGDMRDVRLGRSFDAVLVHDAVVYMTSEAELAEAARTAFLHTRPGGAAIFAPDLLRDHFREALEPLSGDDGERALRGVAWVWDPDPADATYTVDYALLLREGAALTAVHDRHLEGGRLGAHPGRGGLPGGGSRAAHRRRRQRPRVPVPQAQRAAVAGPGGVPRGPILRSAGLDRPQNVSA